MPDQRSPIGVARCLRPRLLMSDHIAANRQLWDAWTKINFESDFYDVESFRDGRKPIRVDDWEQAEVGRVEGKTLLHLQCHFGLDTLSWARLGATVTGADFSEEAVETARAPASELDIPATFVCADLYDLPTQLPGTFDIVYTSRGVLG